MATTTAAASVSVTEISGRSMARTCSRSARSLGSGAVTPEPARLRRSESSTSAVPSARSSRSVTAATVRGSVARPARTGLPGPEQSAAGSADERRREPRARGPHGGGSVRGSWEAVWRSSAASRSPSRRSARCASPRRGRYAGWSGVREAVAFGPPPPQGGHFGMDALAQDAAGDDWLTVNVWSPEPDPGAGLPVMVWIQGGGVRDRHVRPPRVRRRPARAGRRRRRGDVQLPRGDRGLRADRGGAGQPGTARPGRRAGVGARQHPGLRRRPRPGHGLRPVGGRRIGRRAAGDGPRRPGCSAGPSRRACRARSSRRSWPRTSPPPAPPSWGCGPRWPTCPASPRAGCPPPPTRSAPRWTSGRNAGAGPRTGRSPSRPSSTARSWPSRRGRPWPTAPAATSNCSSATPATSSGCSPPSAVCSAR